MGRAGADLLRRVSDPLREAPARIVHLIVPRSSRLKPLDREEPRTEEAHKKSPG